jgi:hypothetical protein
MFSQHDLKVYVSRHSLSMAVEIRWRLHKRVLSFRLFEGR